MDCSEHYPEDGLSALARHEPGAVSVIAHHGGDRNGQVEQNELVGLVHHETNGLNGLAQHELDSAQRQNGGVSAVEQMRCGEWINIGGAIDMKVYTEPKEMYHQEHYPADSRGEYLPHSFSGDGYGESVGRTYTTLTNCHEDVPMNLVTEEKTKELPAAVQPNHYAQSAAAAFIEQTMLSPPQQMVSAASPSPRSATPTPSPHSATPTPSPLPTSPVAGSHLMSFSLPIKRKICLELKSNNEECDGGDMQYEELGRSAWELGESALHQLAEVAEKKKLQEEEEEMMEVGGHTPTGSPGPATPPPMCLSSGRSCSPRLLAARDQHPVSHLLAARDQPIGHVLAAREQPSSSHLLVSREQSSSSHLLATREQPSSSHLLASREQPSREHMLASREHANHSHLLAAREQPSSSTHGGLQGHSSSHLHHSHSLPPMHHQDYDLSPASPLPLRQLKSAPAPTPSPDSAIHSTIYSPSHSPLQSRHGPFSGFSSPGGYHSSHRTTPSLSRNNSDASQYGGSQYSYSSAPSPLSPAHSPATPSRHAHPGYPSPAHCTSSPLPRGPGHISLPLYSQGIILSRHEEERTTDDNDDILSDIAQHSALTAQTGISRQQLINSPCPICGDKISGFHYGIFSCESCKGFFKRTVQNKKNYVCMRGAQCQVLIATRKKCPACRFEKCLKMGMKLEAIREDRTRGGRSTYQCSYTIPQTGAPCAGLPAPGECQGRPSIPILLQEIMDVEHLWFTTTSPPSSAKASADGRSRSTEGPLSDPQGATGGSGPPPPQLGRPPFKWQWRKGQRTARFPSPSDEAEDGMAEAGGRGEGRGRQGAGGEDMVQTLTMMTDQMLYKLVKWCKSLPLFKNILIDDQIALLINAWCELLVLSCCYRSINTPGVIRVSQDVSLSLATAKERQLERWVEKMLHFSEQLRRLRIDRYEYVSMKVIVLLTADTSEIKERDTVRESQEKVVQALQEYTVSHYPDMPSKFGELLLRMPELQRICQVGKEMLCLGHQSKGESEGPGFTFLMELLRGDY